MRNYRRAKRNNENLWNKRYLPRQDREWKSSVRNVVPLLVTYSRIPALTSLCILHLSFLYLFISMGMFERTTRAPKKSWKISLAIGIIGHGIVQFHEFHDRLCVK